jgi:hypothetical protein
MPSPLMPRTRGKYEFLPAALLICALLLSPTATFVSAQEGSLERPLAAEALDTPRRGWNLRGQAARSSGPPLRRMTQREYAYALRDLLQIDEDAAILISESLPPEADAGGFDTMAESQGISALHIRSYLEAANRALDTALVLGTRPESLERKIDYSQGLMTYFALSETFGLGVVKMLDDAAVQFDGAVCTYTMDSERNYVPILQEGRYKVTLDGYRHQADSLVVMTLFKGKTQGIVASLDELIGSWDLIDDETRVVSTEVFLQPGDLVAPCVAEADVPADDPFYRYFEANMLAKNYTGEGVAFRSMVIEGPLTDQWPSASVRGLLPGIELDDTGALLLSKTPEEHLLEIVADFAPRAFGHPVSERSIAKLTQLGLTALDEGQPFVEAVRTPILAILTAPNFLYQIDQRAIPEDYDFAKRLAAFLWRSPPDRELLDLASQGLLQDSYHLGVQVDRMLDDPKSTRFVEDFSGQAWRLDEFRATSPSQTLFPSYNAQLGQSMEAETNLFLAALIADDLGADQLIDSDFTFVNRPLAQLYGIPEVSGQEMRRIALPPDSPRGGLITQASILKITANGTSTSPIPRGNFILEHLLGAPMPPPPAGVPGLEPDTRGSSTIREQLDLHRTNPTCNACHRSIDPPGFALESFDAVGAFRNEYRNRRLVDPSGTTPTGRSFAGIHEYKQILLEENLDQVARHLFQQMLIFATGAETESHDRDEIDVMLDRLGTDGYGIRSMIHEIVASSLFQKTSGLEAREDPPSDPARQPLGRRER